MSLIEVKDVSFSYKGRKALNDVALRIEEGSFVVILGQSGAGKSTLARILNTTLKPDCGSIRICGIECTDRSSSVLARRNVGLVLQNPDSQIVGDTVEDDVAFALENMGLDPLEMDRRIASALSETGLIDLRFHSPRELSGGQKQLLAISAVLAMQCRCIVLDEALSMLDTENRTSVLGLLHRLNREKGLSVVLMTHSIDDAKGADAIHIMDRGRIVESGDLGTVMTSEAGKAVSDGCFSSRLISSLRENSIAVPDTVVTEDDLVSYLVKRGVS